MFNFQDILEQASDLLGGRSLGEMGDVSQMLSDAGVDPSALAEMAPQDAAELLNSVGVDPEILSQPQVSELLASLSGTDPEA